MKKVLFITMLYATISISALQAQINKYLAGPNLNGFVSILDIKENDNSVSVLYRSDGNINAINLSASSLMRQSSKKPIYKKRKENMESYVVEPKEYKYITTISQPKKTILIYEKRIAAEKKINLCFQETDEFCIPINKPTLLLSDNYEIKNEKLKLFQISTESTYEIINYPKIGKFLIIARAPDEKISSSETKSGDVTFILFNANSMQRIAENTYNLKSLAYEIEYVIGDNATIYFLDQIKNDEQNYDMNAQVKSFLKIIRLNLFEANNSATELITKINNKILHSANITISNSNELICSGPYSRESLNYSDIQFEGIFCAKIDPLTGGIFQETEIKLDEKTMRIFADGRKAMNGKFIPFNFKIKGYEKLENGSNVLILEDNCDHNLLVNKVAPTSTSIRTYKEDQYHYISRSVLLINIDPSWKINWVNHIHKNQHTIDDNGIYTSFTYVKDSNKLKFMFTDKADNYDRKSKKVVPDLVDKLNTVNSYNLQYTLAYAEVDESGNLDQRLVFCSEKYSLPRNLGSWASSGNGYFVCVRNKLSFINYCVSCLFPPYIFYLILRKEKNSLIKIMV